MPTVRIRNVCPLGALDIPTIGRVGDTCVTPDEVLDVDSEIAGEAPGIWRQPTPAEKADGLRGLVSRETGQAPDVRVEVLSPGRGLLGSRNFEEVTPPKVAGKNTPNPAQEA